MENFWQLISALCTLKLCQCIYVIDSFLAQEPVRLDYSVFMGDYSNKLIASVHILFLTLAMSEKQATHVRLY